MTKNDSKTADELVKDDDLIIIPWDGKSLGRFSNEMLRGVRIHHKPTGIEITENSRISQHKNKTIAIDKLREKLQGNMPLFTRTVDDEVSKLKSELVELRKKNTELVQFISENTPILSYLAIECTTNLNEFKSWLAVRDLEQQVVGIHKALAWVKKNKSSDSYSRYRLEKYALSLLDETEQLRVNHK